MASHSYLFAYSKTIDRIHACGLCGAGRGHLVGQVNYIGLQDLDMVQCPQCGSIGADPIPEVAVVAEGCDRLYRLQQTGAQRATTLRGFAKSYRRGALFARKHLRQFSPNPRVLEIGAGDGYFSAGLKAQLPGSEITLVDIVEDLMRYYANHHPGFRAHAGEMGPDLIQRLLKGGEKYDLIVFRDLLEHVRDPRTFLKHIHDCAKDKGRIFFITPNGKEDFWMIHQRFMKTGQRSLLLLNHFHYFLPGTLNRLLTETGFRIETGFKFGLKQHRAGLGHRDFSEFGEETMPEIPSKSQSLQVLWAHQTPEVTGKPLSKLGPISRFYSQLVDRERETEPFHSERGHEFFVIAQKERSPEH